MFITALNFAISQNYDYDIMSLVDKYVLAYGKFQNSSELLLKNIIQGNFKVVEILENNK